jgi:uncharacterized membrane protein
MKSKRLVRISLILIILGFVLVLVGLTSSCVKQDTQPKVYNYTTQQSNEIKDDLIRAVQPGVLDNTTVDEDGVIYSFWFVVWTYDGSSKVNAFIAQPHVHFSMEEFKEFSKGDNNFLLNLVPVSYETYQANK